MDADDPQLRRALEESRRTSERMLAQINAITTTIRRDHRRFQEESAARRAEREEANRTGENGADAQRMQQRIDTGQTSWEAIVSGDDDAANAVRIRQNIAAGVSYLRSVVDHDDDFKEQRAIVAQQDEEIRRALRGDHR